MFSKRSSFERRPNPIYLARRERDASQPLIDLTVTNPTLAGIAYPERELLALLSDPADLRYEPHALGRSTAREALSAAWRARGWQVKSERIWLTSSTSEAYAVLFKLLCDPGDEVLVPEPSYPLFTDLAQLETVNLVSYPLTYAGEWQLVGSEIEQRITPRTRAVIVVNPNNPTGSFLKREELVALVELGLPIISDEVFADYALIEDPRRVETALCAEGTLVFALGGLSKSAGLPQLKLAWTSVGGPEPLVEEALARLESILDTFLSPGAAVQRALPRLLELGRVPRAAIRARLELNLRQLWRALGNSEVTPLRIEGGWSAVLRMPNTHGEEQWVLGLLERGVLVQPGYFYDFGSEPYLVLSLLTPVPDFASGVDRLRELVRSWLA